MTIRTVESYLKGAWVAPSLEAARTIESAVSGEVIAQVGGDLQGAAAVLDYAREVGGPALRAMTFHQRAAMVKALAVYLNERRDALYEASFDTGATLSDHKIDIDGGIGTLFVYASKARRELPDDHIALDGGLEQLGREGQFMGQHVCTPLQGVAVHINAFNFPVWGMLEKLAPALIAGVPAVVKPATATCYVTELAVRMIAESDILPAGAVQLVAGGVGDMLDHLGAQDVVGFTGSAATALRLRGHPSVLRNSVRFMAEQDSLNASILGLDAGPGTAEFDLFIKEVSREITVKAGQKCTAIRRILVPQTHVEPVIEALKVRLEKVNVGDPRAAETRMGALVSRDQKADVLEKAGMIGAEAELVFGDPAGLERAGSFVTPLLFHCGDPDAGARVHDTEAFGPVSTVMPYRDTAHAVALANRGGGSLVTSLITRDGELAREVVLGAGAWHGRIYVNNAESMAESTGHGSPMPHMVHGGPGRAGGGEELGGIRGVMHYMQRTAVQGSPDILTAVGGRWVPGAREIEGPAHPFTRRYGELQIGETIRTPAREITLEDIEHFAHFTGDTFYAHMDEDAAQRNPFFPGRVAHGYLMLSFAAGLFVEPNEGPVLANTGLDNLRFMKPVQAGETIEVRLTVKAKTPRSPDYGEVRWHVSLFDGEGDKVAEYELLTMNAF